MVFFFVVGRVCVPIDPNRCDEFDPTTVPTLSQVNLFCNDNFLTCIQGRGKLSTGSVICVFFMREVPIYYLTVFGTCIVKLAPFSNTFSCGKRKYHLLTWLKWGYKVYACISPLHLQFCTIIFFFLNTFCVWILLNIELYVTLQLIEELNYEGSRSDVDGGKLITLEQSKFPFVKSSHCRHSVSWTLRVQVMYINMLSLMLIATWIPVQLKVV